MTDPRPFSNGASRRNKDGVGSCRVGYRFEPVNILHALDEQTGDVADWCRAVGKKDEGRPLRCYALFEIDRRTA